MTRHFECRAAIILEFRIALSGIVVDPAGGIARQQCPEMIEAVTVMGPDRGSRGDRRHRRVGRIIEGVEQGGSLRKNGTQGFDQGFSSRFLLHQGSSFPITGMDRRWIRRRVAEQRATVRANPKSRP